MDRAGVISSWRMWTIQHLPVITFLVAYFCTVVFGNMMYATPLGRELVITGGLPDKFFTFPSTFSAGYWTLLLCPFLLVPVLVYVVRWTLQAFVQRAAELVPELSAVEFAILSGVGISFVVVSFWWTGAWAHIGAGEDAVSSVEARFEILARIGFLTLAVLQSCLVYLGIHALIRAIVTRSGFWITAATLHNLLLALFLIAVNMKWPVLLLGIGLLMTTFAYSARAPFLKVVVGTVLIVAAYFLISAYVFRLGSVQSSSVAERSAAVSGGGMPNLSTRIVGEVPFLIVAALNRMAISYPYYYYVFSAEGAVCGGLSDQARPNPECRPSTLIYGRIFGTDEFEGRGTSPAAVHISAYALGGWPLAFAGLAGASILLGLFSSLPAGSGATIGALRMMGVLAGYHLSQVPGEGVLIYDHGLLWTFLMLAVCLGLKCSFSRKLTVAGR